MCGSNRLAITDPREHERQWETKTKAVDFVLSRVLRPKMTTTAGEGNEDVGELLHVIELVAMEDNGVEVIKVTTAVAGRSRGTRGEAMTAASTLPPQTVEEIVSRAGRPDFDRWAEQVSRCGHCSRPVRLRGRVEHRSADGRRVPTRRRPSRIGCC